MVPLIYCKKYQLVNKIRMAKGKKKYNQAKIDELRRKEQRNRFFNKLERLCFDICNDPKIYKLIPQSDFEFFYKLFGRGVRIQAAEGYTVPAEMLKETKELMPIMLNMQLVQVIPGGKMMSLTDFFSVGFSLLMYLERLEEAERRNYKGAMEVKEALQPFRSFTTRYDEAFGHFNNMLYTIAFMNSDFTLRIYSVKYENLSQTNSKNPIGFTIDIYCQEAEKKFVTLDNIVRPVYRIGWPLPLAVKFMEWCEIHTDKFLFKHKYGKRSFEVYVQSHAFDRMAERIDCIQLGILHLQLFLSIKDPEIIKGEHGRILISLKVTGMKVGYLLGEIAENKIIIKTFLFLTHNGTPEGDLLRKNTGLKKEDQIYLDMDKLSAFILTDMGKDQRLRKIFADAGCSSLFDVEHVDFERPEELKKRSIASLIKKYLGLKEEGEVLEADEIAD